MIRHVTLLACLVGCGPRLSPAVPTALPIGSLDTLATEYQLRLMALPAGWPGGDDCDGTLWAGLAAAVGAPVDLNVVESTAGRIERRPTPCYTTELGDRGSSSSISNDMLLGYIWGRWAQGDLAALQRLADYGIAHSWVMGDPFPEHASAVVLKPNQYLLLAKAIEQLSGGADHRAFGGLPPTYVGVVADYEQHLQVLSILLYGETFGGIDAGALSHLTGLCGANPSDALFQAACGLYSGNFVQALALLLGDYSSPSYVRGASIYSDIHWLFAAKQVLTAAGRLPK